MLRKKKPSRAEEIDSLI